MSRQRERDLYGAPAPSPVVEPPRVVVVRMDTVEIPVSTLELFNQYIAAGWRPVAGTIQENYDILQGEASSQPIPHRPVYADTLEQELPSRLSQSALDERYARRGETGGTGGGVDFAGFSSDSDLTGLLADAVVKPGSVTPNKLSFEPATSAEVSDLRNDIQALQQAPGSSGGTLRFIDNGDGTVTISGTAVVDNGDGTVTIVVDNGDGTITIN